MERMRDEWAMLKAGIAGLVTEINTLETSKRVDLTEDPANGSTVEQLCSQVEAGFLRRSNEHVEAVFGRFSVTTVRHEGAQSVGVIQKDKLSLALEALGIILSEENELDTIVKAVDLNNDGVLNLEEFFHLIQLSAPKMPWIRSLPLAELLWDAMPKEKDRALLRTVGDMTHETIEHVSLAFKLGLVKLLTEQCTIAKSANKAKSERSATSEFKVTSMNCGAIADFHSGLMDRVAYPSLQFPAAMESEHCLKAGCNHKFTTGNYQITTTPADEWAITVESEFSKADTSNGRRLVPIEELMKLEVVMESKLALCEVIAVVLYTGPLFTIYNSILRRDPIAIYEVFAKGGNLLSTTINVLVSSVQKISRTMKLPEGIKLLRGLGGTRDLPQSFYESDAQGCRGFTEWGFMSFTSSKEMAIMYSGVRDGKPLAMVLELETGAVCRGACVRDMSQYPAEIEYHIPPCSFIEPAGAPRLEFTPHGPVTVVPVKLFPNIKTMTIEGLLGQKKSMHIAAFRFTLSQIREELEDTASKGGLKDRIAADWSKSYDGNEGSAESFIKRIVDQCEEFFTRQSDIKPNAYTEDEAFRAIVVEMLDVKAMAAAKLQFYLVDKSASMYYVLDMSLREAYRALLDFMRRTLPCSSEERKKAAAEICRLEGMMHEGVNELGEPRIVSAAAEGISASRLELLLTAGAQLSGTDMEGNTALHVASRYGQRESLQALLDQKADVNALNQDEETPVLLAAWNGHTKAIELLLSAKADVNSKPENGWTPLIAAAGGGHLEVIKTLVKSKADVLSTGNYGESPLWLAAVNGHVECIMTLLQSKADVDAVDKDGKSPLFVAALSGHVECVRALVFSKANVNAVTEGGETPLYKAAQKGHLECLRMLVEGKADINVATKAGDTALCSAATVGSMPAIQMLINMGVDVKAANKCGETALTLAVLNRHWEAAEALLQAGGLELLQSRDIEGWSCLHYAIAQGQNEAAQRVASCAGAVGRTFFADVLAEFTSDAESGSSSSLLEPFRGGVGEMFIWRHCIRFVAFTSARARAYCPRGSKAYYELEIVKLGRVPQFGFCTDKFKRVKVSSDEGVGDDDESLGVDGARVQRWHGGPSPFGIKWTAGDVIGLACEMPDTGGLRMLFSVNGNWIEPGNGLVFDLPDRRDERIHPAFTGKDCWIRVNLGNSPWIHGPPPEAGYKSFWALGQGGCIDEQVQE